MLLALGISAQKGKNLVSFISGGASASCRSWARKEKERSRKNYTIPSLCAQRIFIPWNNKEKSVPLCVVWLGKLNDLSINQQGRHEKSWFVHQRNLASNDRPRACQVEICRDVFKYFSGNASEPLRRPWGCDNFGVRRRAAPRVRTEWDAWHWQNCVWHIWSSNKTFHPISTAKLES